MCCPSSAVGRWGVSDEALNLMARVGMVRADGHGSSSMWVVDTRERIKFVLNTAQKHLSNLKGLVPSMPPDERQTLNRFLRR
jgi:hypothetical protein